MGYVIHLWASTQGALRDPGLWDSTALRLVMPLQRFGVMRSVGDAVATVWCYAVDGCVIALGWCRAVGTNANGVQFHSPGSRSAPWERDNSSLKKSNPVDAFA